MLGTSISCWSPKGRYIYIYIWRTQRRSRSRRHLFTSFSVSDAPASSSFLQRTMLRGSSLYISRSYREKSRSRAEMCGKILHNQTLVLTQTDKLNVAQLSLTDHFFRVRWAFHKFSLGWKFCGFSFSLSLSRLFSKLFWFCLHPAENGQV